jgi:hypothetical protein
MITLDRDDHVWQYPHTADLDPDNPAVQARAEHIQHEYAEAVFAPLSEADAVNDYETVPAAGEVQGYAANNGNVIDPAHSEAVLAAAEASVANAFADPDMLAMHRANEEQRLKREHQAEALSRATALTERIGDMQDRALLDWGADAAQGE